MTERISLVALCLGSYALVLGVLLVLLTLGLLASPLGLAWAAWWVLGADDPEAGRQTLVA